MDFSFAISKIISLMYKDICSSCELVQMGTWIQLKINPSSLLGALWNCEMMHVWVTLNWWASSPHTKVSGNWPCQMLAWWMNFHLVAFELVQLLPYRCLWTDNSVDQCELRCDARGAWLCLLKRNLNLQTSAFKIDLLLWIESFNSSSYFMTVRYLIDRSNNKCGWKKNAILETNTAENGF